MKVDMCEVIFRALSQRESVKLKEKYKKMIGRGASWTKKLADRIFRTHDNLILLAHS